MTTRHSSFPWAETESPHRSSSVPANPSASLEPSAFSHQGLVKLSDSELLAQLAALVKQDHALTVAVLLHLAEVERRGLHLAKGYSSLFAYCVQRLGFSEDVAYKRVGAARYGRRFPWALELIAQGALHVSALMLIGPHLTDENHREWLTAVTGKTKREVELLIATRLPKPDVPSAVRKLPTRQPPIPPQTSPGADAAIAQSHPSIAEVVTPNPPTAPALNPPTRADTPQSEPRCGTPRERRCVQPLSFSTFRIVFTAREALKEKLDRARELCSHSVAPNDLPALFERALDVLIEHEERRRYAARASDVRSKHLPTQPSQQDPDPAGAVKQERGTFSRHVPAAVRRVVWQRDGGQCTFVGDDGMRCTERKFLEIDHVVAHARGGPTTSANCRLACAAHNQHRAKVTFGTEFIERARSRKRTRTSGAAHP